MSFHNIFIFQSSKNIPAPLNPVWPATRTTTSWTIRQTRSLSVSSGNLPNVFQSPELNNFASEEFCEVDNYDIWVTVAGPAWLVLTTLLSTNKYSLSASHPHNNHLRYMQQKKKEFLRKFPLKEWEELDQASGSPTIFIKISQRFGCMILQSWL